MGRHSQQARPGAAGQGVGAVRGQGPIGIARAGVTVRREARARRSDMTRTLAFANQKGGVAKTTSTLGIAVGLGERGHRVLAVDLDPQGALTYSMGVDPDEL